MEIVRPTGEVSAVDRGTRTSSGGNLEKLIRLVSADFVLVLLESRKALFARFDGIE